LLAPPLGRGAKRVAVVGGGAAGVFAAITCARTAGGGKLIVEVFEATATPLDKVARSGGGRCNVMHDPAVGAEEIVKRGYPRGHRELRSVIGSVFTPDMTHQWFEAAGVPLKVEQDGRVFPVSDSSGDVVDALLRAAKEAGVKIHSQSKILSVAAAHGGDAGGDGGDGGNGYEVRVGRKGGEELFHADAVIVASGSAACGRKWSERLGHDIVPPVPSLFGFKLAGGSVLDGLPGLSLPDVALTLVDKVPGPAEEPEEGKKKKKKGKGKPGPAARAARSAGVDPKVALTRRGPMLITHTGITGPAALQLSAFTARGLAEFRYKGVIEANLAPPLATNHAFEAFQAARGGPDRKKKVANGVQHVLLAHPATKHVGSKLEVSIGDRQVEGWSLPKRLWKSVCDHSGLPDAATWADLSDAQLTKLAECLTSAPLSFTNRSPHKEEFVTAGGVALKQVDFRASEDSTKLGSRVSPGLYFCGEVLDIDGVTGGFNFQSAWSTGYAAGSAAACFALAVDGDIAT